MDRARSAPSKTEMIGKTIGGQYVIRKHIGGGSFGDVFEAEDSQNGRIVALKFETDADTPQLPNEYKMYRTLQGMDGVPQIYSMFEHHKSNVLVMDSMGPSLEELFVRCGRRFSLKTTLMIADQIIRILEWVHSCGVLHRDIKPQNFLVGRGELANKIFLIDFGVSTFYLEARTHEHYIYTRGNGLVGTANYVSINTHLSDQQSRRDDLESVLYVLVRFLYGKLPWEGIEGVSADDRNDKIAHSKMQIPTEALCADLPKEFSHVLGTIRRLNFDEHPAYAKYRALLTSLFVKNGFVYDGLFDWNEAAPIHKPLPSVYLLRMAIKYQQDNDRLIRSRREKVVLPLPMQAFVAARGV
jgi:serine/threonine protein kinase